MAISRSSDVTGIAVHTVQTDASRGVARLASTCTLKIMPEDLMGTIRTMLEIEVAPISMDELRSKRACRRNRSKPMSLHDHLWGCNGVAVGRWAWSVGALWIALTRTRGPCGSSPMLFTADSYLAPVDEESIQGAALNVDTGLSSGLSLRTVRGITTRAVGVFFLSQLALSAARFLSGSWRSKLLRGHDCFRNCGLPCASRTRLFRRMV